MQQTQVLQQFKLLNGWENRYRYLMKVGTPDNLPFDSSYRSERYLVDGCESQVWLYINAGKYYATSDSRIVKGLLCLILTKINELPSDQVAHFELGTFLQEFNLEKHLSESRSNGLHAVISQIKKLNC
ncbi:SufE family protein [Catenovulum sediminis]|uniref:SufE family protein n=1 Tax=Catenovulum sediminis TaxID=1740262 RepID=A0ABV1RLX1_9ALTE|nr:SufE family protein [Catenovulum sediminis]